MTKADLIEELAQLRFKNYYLRRLLAAPVNVAATQIKQAAAQFTDAEWDALTEGIVRSNQSEAGQVLIERVHEYLLEKARTDISEWLADDIITTDQLLETY